MTLRPWPAHDERFQEGILCVVSLAALHLRLDGKKNCVDWCLVRLPPNSHVICTHFRVQRAPMATASASSPTSTTNQVSVPQAASTNIITALGQVFKLQGDTTMSSERIAHMLAQNMGQLGELAKQGKLNQQQIAQVRAHCSK
jgi:hypothetical protein